MHLPIRLGIVGFGKIARDQHLPALIANPNFALQAVASREPVAGLRIPAYPSFEAMIDANADLQAVSFCMPSQGRAALARRALERGLHVLLEKPPGCSVAEVAALGALAERHGAGLYASWHSRHAPAVEAARVRLAAEPATRARIEWKEDVRKWHPGQHWIWQSGGLGVFDAGINALSIITHIWPRRLFVETAEFQVPANCLMPIAATLTLSDGRTAIEVEFDFRAQGSERWDIHIESSAGPLHLGAGGATLTVAGKRIHAEGAGEYEVLYRHFEGLVRERRRELDCTPLQLVADAFLIARRHSVEPFLV